MMEGKVEESLRCHVLYVTLPLSTQLGHTLSKARLGLCVVDMYAHSHIFPDSA